MQTPRLPQTRDFRLDDQSVVRQLIQDGLRSRWGHTYDPAVNPDTDDLLATYISPGGEIVVAEIDNQVVATGILCIEPTPAFLVPAGEGSDIPRLRRISVSDAHRRRGLGRLIVHDLIERAFQRGFDRVLVSTDTPWTDAIALYESCGFSTVHIDPEETHLVLTITDN